MRYLPRRPIGLSVSPSVSPLRSRPYLNFLEHEAQQQGCLANINPFSIYKRPQYRQHIPPVTGSRTASKLSKDAAHLSTNAPSSILSLSRLDDCLGLEKYFPQEYLNFDEVLYQADVTGDPRPDGRLVDQFENRENFELWTKLLHTRLRLHGIAGAWDIWLGLRSRGVDVPTSGEQANQLWTAFVSAAIQKQRLKELWQYVLDLYKRTTLKYDLLYDQIVGFFLQNQDKSKAQHWHKRFKDIDLPLQGSLARLVDDAVYNSQTLKIFRILYETSNDRTIYDKMITTLCEQGDYWQAMKWHELCVSKDDLPSSASVTDPLRRHLALAGEMDKLRQLTETLVNAGVSFAGSIPKQFKENTKISRVIMSKLLGEIHGVKPKTISDQFCARSFATRSFSVDLVIRGLTAFGVELIGPLALRELVLRCEKMDEIKQHFGTLARLNVKIQECTYTETIQRLVYGGKRAMLTSVMESDMHPDVYDDRILQKDLLTTHMSTQDWPQVHRTLMILSVSHPAQRTGAWNTLLRAYMDSRNWDKVSNVFEDMLLLQVFMSPKTIRHSFFSILRQRNAGKRPVSLSVHFDDLSFLTSLWLRTIRIGGDIPAEAWRQVHTYYGMEGRYIELEKLSKWLALYYSRKTVRTISQREHPAMNEGSSLRARPEQDIRPSLRTALSLDDTNRNHPLRRVFTVQRQLAIVAWAFKLYGNFERTDLRPADSWPAKITSAYRMYQKKVGLVKRLHPYPQWARGVALLKELRELGVHVHTATVRKACRQRLIMLFGRGRSRKKENRRAQSSADVRTLRHMILFLNCLWGRGLFPMLGINRKVKARDLQPGGRSTNKFMYERLLGLHVYKRKKGLRVRRRPIVG